MGLDLLRRPGPAVRLALAALALGLALAPAPAQATEEEALEAAFVFKFLSFVRWPEGALGEGAVTVCVLGAPELGEALEAIRGGHDVDGRPLAVRPLEDPKEMSGCHALFLGSRTQSPLSALLGALEGEPVLTVSDVPGFARKGGMIGLLSKGGKLRFELHRGAARSAGLGFSARLLRLAAEVRP